MKIIPFARETKLPPAPEPAQRFGTFPRVRAKDDDEPVEILAARFSDLNSGSLSPPLSASSFKTTFSSIHTVSSPATSPELGHPELPLVRKSGSHGRRDGRLKGTSSRESVRTLFSSSSSQSLNAKAKEESDWEKTLEDAASRASWQSSINHRPRQHTASGHKRTASNQSTWPRAISNPVHQRDSLMLEHVFVDATDNGQSSQYAAPCYSGFPVENDSSWSLPGSRQHSVAGSNSSLQSRSAYAVPPPQAAKTVGQGRFGTLPRMKVRRPSTTGSSFRGEPAAFELKPTASAVPSQPAALGTASLGRATSLRRRAIPDAASLWQMGRRRSSGMGFSGNASGSFSAAVGGGAARMLPTIPQGHSRETSLADDDLEPPSWAGIDPYTQPLSSTDIFARGYRQDSLASDGSGEFIPLRFYGARRESQDDLALLPNRRRSSNNSNASSASFASGRAAAGGEGNGAAGGPVFNLHPFQKRPSLIRRSISSQDATAGFRRHAADVPVSEAEDGDGDGDLIDLIDNNGWCRRRSTFSNLVDPVQ